MSSSVRPIPRESAEIKGVETQNEQLVSEQSVFEQPTADAESTPVSETFFSGGAVPVSLFGDQSRGGQPAMKPLQDSPAAEVPPAPAVQPAQTPFAQTPASTYYQAPQNPYQQAYQQPYQQSYQQPQPFQQPFQNPYAGGGFSQPPMPMPMPRVNRGGNEDNELTIISRNTVIDGNIRSFADMSVDGDIKGDVETTKDIDLNGKIVGNITCNNAMMHTAQVQGNVRMKGNISMKRDTLLMGDLMSTYAEVNGKVKGNLDVVGKADLKGDAVVFGDISASTITVEDGAIIQGYVSTTFLNKEESKNLFPETVVINDVRA
jgi:cytoskeletal protein CcmA (bactofilin family)